jgi:hypothetical protein
MAKGVGGQSFRAKNLLCRALKSRLSLEQESFGTFPPGESQSSGEAEDGKLNKKAKLS